ncbi:MAG: LysR family transcriptional regulator [Gammaproteobacteria bacterium]|nr:MAG: LysR family transcriptional regulator [Gammaproteobacteria bacterium]
MKISARQIEVFLAIMEYGTVTAAAEHLHVSQPAVSRMLDRFEAQTGFKAFVRSGTRLKPTAAGLVFYSEVKQVYKGLEYLNQIAVEVRDNRRGYLYIGVFPALSNSWIASRIRDFLLQHDHVLVSIVPMPSAEIVGAVSRQAMDIGITAGPSDDPGVECRPLAELQAVCILPSGHSLCRKKRIHARDLSGQDFVSLSSLDKSRTRIDAVFDQLAIRRNIRLETAQASSVCHMVASGVGVSVVTRYVAEEYAHLGYALRPFEPAIRFQTFLLRALHRPYSTLADQLLEHLTRDP